jgi:hypothetical protein
MFFENREDAARLLARRLRAILQKHESKASAVGRRIAAILVRDYPSLAFLLCKRFTIFRLCLLCKFYRCGRAIFSEFLAFRLR